MKSKSIDGINGNKTIYVNIWYCCSVTDEWSTVKNANLVLQRCTAVNFWHLWIISPGFQICLRSANMNQSSTNFRLTSLSIFSTLIQEFMQIEQALFALETITWSVAMSTTWSDFVFSTHYCYSCVFALFSLPLHPLPLLFEIFPRPLPYHTFS